MAKLLTPNLYPAENKAFLYDSDCNLLAESSRLSYWSFGVLLFHYIRLFKMIIGIHHINLLVPEGTLDDAIEFYANTLGLTPTPVPHLQVGRIAW